MCHAHSLKQPHRGAYANSTGTRPQFRGLAAVNGSANRFLASASTRNEIKNTARLCAAHERIACKRPNSQRQHHLRSPALRNAHGTRNKKFFRCRVDICLAYITQTEEDGIAMTPRRCKCEGRNMSHWVADHRLFTSQPAFRTGPICSRWRSKKSQHRQFENISKNISKQILQKRANK